MILQSFGITLRLINEDDLEMVLTWRNSEHIRQYAISQEIISFETHKEWFGSLQEKGDLYFIIESDEKAVGLIWANRFKTNSCETGMYVYDREMQNSLFSYRVSLTLNEYLFNVKKLDSISCEILNSNSRSARFTLSLGYIELEKSDHITSYFLTKMAFIPHFEKISKLLNKSSKK